MRRGLLPFAVALTLATAAPTTAQTRLDLSSPEAVMVSLQDLAGRWTHPQFIELLRAAILVHQVPDYLDDPASFQQGLNRWTLLAEGVLLSMGVLIQAPLVLEGEPFLRHAEAELVKPWLHVFLSETLEGRTMEELVDLGRARERGILVRWREQHEERLVGLEQQIEDARAVLSQPDAAAQDAHALERLERRHRDVVQAMDHLNRRLHALEAEPFTPGAVECSLEEGIDLSSEQAMVADLERLADTCPQRSLIAFLRAAALVSEVPVRLADPGARLHAVAMREVEENLVSAADAIAKLPAFLRKDPFVARVDVPQRLARILGNALAGRTMAEVMRDGATAEHAFLIGLRADLSQRLRAETRRSEQTADASEPPNSRISRLQAQIERIDLRLRDLAIGDGSVH